MKLNNKGFAVSGILYPLLILFIMLIIGVLDIMSSRKVVFDQAKNDIITELDNPNSLRAPEITVIGKNITILNNTNIPNFNFDLKENVSAINSDGVQVLKNDIMIKSEPAFNQSQSGIYKITYIVTDTSGKMATASRVVNVVDQTENVNSWNYSYSGTYDKLTISKDGLYLIQAWGASGYGGSFGGKGAYTSGTIELFSNDQLYMFVGEGGKREKDIYGTITENFNGGGSYACGDVRYTAGGASDVRLKGPTTTANEWSDSTSLASRIMVAAGGGAAGQTSRDDNPVVQGGPGGTLTSKNGFGSSGAIGVSQTTGFKLGAGESFGSITNTCGSSNASPGGGGYYGGFASKYPGSSGSGGSSYISGFDGCVTNNEKLFDNTVMIPGDANMPTHNGNGTMKGNSGDGYIKILQLKVVNE